MSLTLELIVLLAAIAIGARAGGVGMGLWGGGGLAVLVFGFGLKPGSIPGDVLLIILTVIMAASAMERPAASTISCTSPKGSSARVRST